MTRSPGGSPRHHTPAATRAPVVSRFWLLLAAVAYLTFVVYGSLVPLSYRALPWGEALQRFQSIPYLALGIGSRADWVANILLFIPLLFLWAGVVWPWRHPVWRLPTAVLLLAAALALSVAIEFAQLYFPPRTVALNDIVAETAGAAIGIALWWALGGHTMRWLDTLPLVRGKVNLAQRLLVVYLLVLFGYNMMPLDLTISPVEIFRKWRAGHVIWLPFTTPYADGAQRVYDLVTDVAIWVPAAALWQLAMGRTRAQTWLSAVAAAALLELLQLFVYSRVTDSTDVVMAGIGAAIGVALVRPGAAAAPASAGPVARDVRLWILATACWLAVIAAVFWYPFDFNLDRDFLRDRLAGLQRVPFEAYYFGSEFRAVTEVLRKSLFLAPLGFLLFKIGQGLPAAWPRRVVHWCMLILIATVAAVIESVQLLLPHKNADITDAALEFLGGLIGYGVGRFVADSLAPGPAQLKAAAPNPSTDVAVTPPGARPRGLADPAVSALWLSSIVAAVVLLTLLWTAPHLPQVPYNVRELLAPAGAPWTPALLAFAAGLVLGLPILIAETAALRPLGLPIARTVAFLLGVPGIAAAVVFLGGPTESVRDLVGNAAYAWWPWGETWLRLTALLLGAVWSAALGCALQGLPLARGDRGSAVAHLLLHGLWIVPLWHGVVVHHATTDNLTELMSGGGNWLSSMGLLAYGTLCAATSASLLSSLAARSSRELLRVPLVVASSLVAGYGLLSAATEAVVVKYGQVFSALQFLLSADRSTYATGHELLLRFAAAHLLVCLAAACAMAVVLATAARHAQHTGRPRPATSRRATRSPA